MADGENPRLLAPLDGVNEEWVNPGLELTESGTAKMAARAALVRTVNRYTVPDLIKIMSGAAFDGSTKCGKCGWQLKLYPDLKDRLTAHATALKYALGEEMTVKIGNELLFKSLVAAACKHIPEEQHAAFKGEAWELFLAFS